MKNTEERKSTKYTEGTGKQKSDARNLPELLAPAGGMKQLIAAVENGADAVYLGGPLFNARINADNFTEPEIKEAIDYAHLRNVKVYITLNILLTDEELLPALQYGERLYKMGADALILQDLGLADLIKTWLPDFPIHLSTQGSIYNLSGVKKAKDLGFSRVVLARELSLAEIQAITKETDCPVEVFAHGALCMCYSGQCQMSRALGSGDRSGNRGLCAQPCRLPYRDEKGNTGFMLSPKDLCTIDCLGELAEAGVASLKIEGRMKFPEYVAAVTGIYRKYLDQYQLSGSYLVSQEDREMLEQIFNRGGFTRGYLFGNPGKKLLSGKLPKHQGVYIGTVLQRVKGTKLIDVKLEKELKMGDGVEIRSRQLTGNRITYLSPLPSPKEKKKEHRARIGDIKGKVQTGDEIYRISSLNLMDKLEETYEQGGPHGTKHRKKVPVRLSLCLSMGKPPILTATEGNLQVTFTDEEHMVQKGEKHALTKEQAQKQLGKTGGTPFLAEDISVDLEEGCTLPLSALNKARREILQNLAEQKLKQWTEGRKAALPEHGETIFFRKQNRNQEESCSSLQEKALAFYYFSESSFREPDPFCKLEQAGDYLGAENLRAYIPLRTFMEASDQKLCQRRNRKIRMIPYVLNISKGRLDQYIEAHLEEIAEKTKPWGIAVGNLGWIQEFRSRGIPVYGDYGLNLYNRQAVQAMEEEGVQPLCFSLEACPPNLASEDGTGSFPLMIMEYRTAAKKLTDRKNQQYKIVYNVENDKTILLPEQSELNLKSLKKRWEKARKEVRVYIP